MAFIDVLYGLFSEFFWILFGIVAGALAGFSGELYIKTRYQSYGFFGNFDGITYIMCGIVGGAISGIADLFYLASSVEDRVKKMLIINGICFAIIFVFRFYAKWSLSR